MASLDRTLRLSADFSKLLPEDFNHKEGVVANAAWLNSAISSGRRVPVHLWVSYREWVDDVIDGQVEHEEHWHQYVVARALGLPIAYTDGVKPGEAADLLALLAEDRLLGPGDAAIAMEDWLGKSREAFDLRFRKATHRTFDGLTQSEEGTWDGGFYFVQFADPQLGMLHGDKSWEEERAMLNLAIQHVNRLKPRFLLISGDLTNAWPCGPQANAEAAAKQVRSVKQALRDVDSSIPIVMVPGNHDIGQVPSPAELDLYTSRWGDDYFSFWVGGVYFMVLNSQFYMDGSLTQAQKEAQDDWLEKEFQSLKTSRPKHIVILSHVPPFVKAPSETQGWANWERDPRDRIVKLALEAGARLWLNGHYHGNASTTVDGLEVITTSSVCTVINWTEEPGVVATSNRPDFEKCVGMPPLLAEVHHSGFRIVKIDENGHRHRWFVLADVPDSLREAFEQDVEFSSPRRKKKRATKAVTDRLGLEEGLNEEEVAFGKLA
eukprot:CAMPEP_0197658842 /NCGR_PEP_ID=MMETSP1338-20131121/45475_1 /TAXON_ID=43686 ORGANISM="Pelagodinium beii, Strain RCC1491" /NCGR_SAMPLE_ID=MMETSP1338 /ASSEMBLY_ACC=CAM_ASM_000754 /LENGTH=490 /DNA_ID=CAMNT_0043235507 /DNA_START=77 /DNA_END=1549 /DNA_ORIENTATION=-